MGPKWVVIRERGRGNGITQMINLETNYEWEMKMMC